MDQKVGAVMKAKMVEVDPREIKLLEVNARYMPHEQYAQLVANVRRDGILSSVPFCWTTEAGELEVLSGNHRVQAAIDAELSTIDVMVAVGPLTEHQRVAIQLSHNSITGMDDPATLKALYESIGDIDLKDYAGLDDKMLDLLDKVSIESLSEAALEFTTVSLTFLPPELDAARQAFDQAGTMVADEQWIARMPDYGRMLDALDETRMSYNIGNVATALHVILSVYEENLSDLLPGAFDPDGDPKHAGNVPISVVVNARNVPAEAGAVIKRAIDRIADREELSKTTRWRALELMAADYLAGSDPDPSRLKEADGE